MLVSNFLKIHCIKAIEPRGGFIVEGGSLAILEGEGGVGVIYCGNNLRDY